MMHNGSMEHNLRHPLERSAPGFWWSIAGVLIGVAVGNVGLALAAQLGSWLGVPLMYFILFVSGAAPAILVPYVTCRVAGVEPELRRALLRSFAIAAIPFGLAFCAAKEALRLRDLASKDMASWQSFLWVYDRAVTRSLLVLAFVLAAIVFWRRRRPVSWYRAAAVTAVGIALAWFAKEWLEVHRAWEARSVVPASRLLDFCSRMMLSASAHVFFSISLGVTAILLIWEWPGYRAARHGRRLFVRNVALAIALFAFAGMAVLRPMVQMPRQMMKLLRQLERAGNLDAEQQAELLQFGAPAVEGLKKLAQDSSANPVARMSAANMLAPLDDEKATAFLLDLLHDLSPEVRTRAFRLLQKKSPDRAADRLVEMLGDEWAEYRLFAVTGLGRLRRRPAPTELVLLLQDESKLVRRNAAWALGEIGDKECVPELVTALEDKEKDVRGVAATALYRIGDTRAVPALRKTLNDDSEFIRYLSAEALGHLGDPAAVPVLVEAVEKGCGLRPGSGVKVSVRKMVEAMANIPAESVLPALNDLYRRAPSGAKGEIAYAIDYVRQKDLERKLGGEKPPK